MQEPWYAIMDLDEVQGLQEIKAGFYSYFNGQQHGNRIWTGVVSGIGVSFIEPLYYSSFFSREKVYGYSDDFERLVANFYNFFILYLVYNLIVGILLYTSHVFGCAPFCTFTN